MREREQRERERECIDRFAVPPLNSCLPQQQPGCQLLPLCRQSPFNAAHDRPITVPQRRSSLLDRVEHNEGERGRRGGAAAAHSDVPVEAEQVRCLLPPFVSFVIRSSIYYSSASSCDCSPFIRPKFGRQQIATTMEQREACKALEKVLVQNIQFGLSPSLTEAIASVSR